MVTAKNSPKYMMPPRMFLISAKNAKMVLELTALSLLVRQPARLLGEIRNEKKCRDTDEHGHHAFQDEDPSPITQTVDPVHFGDCASKKAAKSGGQQDGTPENREASLRLFSFIPEAENVKACICSSVVRVSHKPL